MITPGVYREVEFDIEEVATREQPRSVLMCSPDYFDVVDTKNVHMEGNVGSIDKQEAMRQWLAIHDQYTAWVSEGLLENVYTISAAAGCEDMVFTANQSFPWLLNGNKTVLMSKMRHDSRKREVPHFKKFYEDKGYAILNLQAAPMFEGMGDVILHPGKQLLYGGYGHRTELSAYDEIAKLLNVPVVPLELKDERFYHLDTCFVPLDEDTVMLCAEAFTFKAFAVLKNTFKNIIRIPATEAADTFSLNAHVLSFPEKKRKVAMIQYGSAITYEALKHEGFEIAEVDTSEFMKSGGSVFCMKMMMY